MDTFRPTSAACLWMCLCVASAVAQSPPVADPSNIPAAPRPANPEPLTTDTLEYCGQLFAELAAKQDMPQQVRELTTEGRRMCDEGHIIGGVARLRHAIMMMRQDTSRR
jgi:hypothetical protein